MSERKIVWGLDEDTADYVTRVDTDDNDRVIVAETNDGTVLLEYDGDAEQWVYGGPVEMGGEDLDNVGAVNADSVTTAATETDLLKSPMGKIADDASRRAFYFHTPQAIKSGDKTYIVYRGADADPYIRAYDHDTTGYEGSVKVGDNPLDVDDEHGVPGLTVDDDGDIHVFFGAHDDPFQYAVSDNDKDITSWSQSELDSLPNGTYPSMATHDNDIYVLYRADDPDTTDGHGSSYPAHEYATIVKSTDGGDSWTDIGPVIDTTGTSESHSDAYVSDLSEHDGMLHLSWTVARGDEHDDIRKNAYHALFDPSDETLETIGGTGLGSTIDWSEHSDCLVYDAQELWSAYHAIEDDGTVHVLHNDNEDDGDRFEWRLSTYEDGSWSTQSVGLGSESRANYGRPRITEDGTVEAYIVGGPSGAADTLHRARLIDGSWEIRRYGSLSEETPFQGVETVRNGTDNFAALVSQSDPKTDAETNGIWALPEAVDSPDTRANKELPIGKEGSVLPLITAVGVEKSTASTSSTDYQKDVNFSAARVGWSDVFNRYQQIAVGLAIRVDSGPADIRIQNASQGETIVEETDLDGGNYFLGYEDYDPPDFGGTDLVRTEYRSNDGSDITVTDPLLYVGVRF